MITPHRLLCRLTPDCSEDTGSEPNVTGLGSQVPGGTVEHVRVDDVDDETSDVVKVSGEDDSLGSETGGSNLSDERVTDGSDSEIVETGKEDEDGSSSVVLAVSAGLDCSQHTGHQHEDVERSGTPQVAGKLRKNTNELTSRCGG